MSLVVLAILQPMTPWWSEEWSLLLILELVMDQSSPRRSHSHWAGAVFCLCSLPSSWQFYKHLPRCACSGRDANDQIDLDIGSTPSFLYSQIKTLFICLNPCITNAVPLVDLTHTVSALDFGIRDLLICPLATTQLIWLGFWFCHDCWTDHKHQ